MELILNSNHDFFFFHAEKVTSSEFKVHELYIVSVGTVRLIYSPNVSGAFAPTFCELCRHSDADSLRVGGHCCFKRLCLLLAHPCHMLPFSQGFWDFTFTLDGRHEVLLIGVLELMVASRDSFKLTRKLDCFC